MNELVAGLGNLELHLPDPTYLDAFMQFFKNMYGLVILIVMMTFMGMVVEEKVRGSVLLVLSKGLSRSSFILCKFGSSVLFFSVGYGISVLVHLSYTSFLFPPYLYDAIWIPLMLFWLYGIFMIALTLLCSTLVKTTTMAAVMSFIAYGLVSISGSIPRIGSSLPGSFQNLGAEMMLGSKGLHAFILPAAVTFGLICMIVFSTVFIFIHQEI